MEKIMINCAFENGNKANLRHVVVDSLILRGDELLLHKRSNKLNEPGKWSLAGGFLEQNETVAEGARREIFEETGYRVKNLTLLQIVDNPNRRNDDRQNISFAFFCTADKKDGRPDWEAAEQKWFKLDNLPPKEDIAFDFFDIIECYRHYLKESPPLPIFGL